MVSKRELKYRANQAIKYAKWKNEIINERLIKETKYLKRKEQAEVWYKEYLSGKTILQIALEYGIKYKTIRNHFEQFNLTFKLYRKKKNPKAGLYQQIRDSKEYKNWRTFIFERDDYTCQECGKRGGYLEVHHIKEFAIIIKEADIQYFEQVEHNLILFDVTNGITLCKACHENKHLLYAVSDT